MSGTGVLNGLTLGKVEYAPVFGFINYHLPLSEKIRPFIGAGFVYNHILDTEDNGITSLDVDNAIGPALRVGIDYFINDNWGGFVSVNKGFLDHTITGNAPVFGNAPITAKADLDPWVVHLGASYRF